MKRRNMTTVIIVAAMTAAVTGAITLGAGPASAVTFRITGDFDQVCKSGNKSELQSVSGTRDVFLTHQRTGPNAITVCVPSDSPGNALVQWGSHRVWRNTGNLRNACVELTNANSVKVRAVNTNFRQYATFYTCTP